MELYFESNLDDLLAAIEAVCDLFRGQEICRTEFTARRESGAGQAAVSGLEGDLGIGTRLTLLRAARRREAGSLST
jgi:type III restriction enzyme